VREDNSELTTSRDARRLRLYRGKRPLLNSATAAPPEGRVPWTIVSGDKEEMVEGDKFEGAGDLSKIMVLNREAKMGWESSWRPRVGPAIAAPIIPTILTAGGFNAIVDEK
jgi:hypothetical protein